MKNRHLTILMILLCVISFGLVMYWLLTANNVSPEQIYKIFIPLYVAATVSTVLFYAYMDKYIYQDIERLTKTVNSLSLGNLNVEVKPSIKQRKDEIGDLAKAFDRTFVSLKLAMHKADPELRRMLQESKKAQETLRASSERHRALFEYNPLMCFTIDEDGNVLSLNKAAVEQLGYPEKELIGQSVLKVFHPDDRDAVLEQARACLKDPRDIHYWEFRKITKTGKTITVREYASVVKDANGKPIIYITCEDITDRKKAGVVKSKSEKKIKAPSED